MGGGLSNAELIRTERSDGAIALILRRLATSIRKQDWFAVVIETLIVVMGVYLGIQLGQIIIRRRFSFGVFLTVCPQNRV